MEERAVNIIIILFVLSLITERVTNLVKLYFPEKGIWWNKFTKKNFYHLKTRSNHPEIEKRREFRMMIISLVSGSIVAIIFRADITEILRTADSVSFGWSWEFFNLSWDEMLCDLPRLILVVLGCITTGFFISMGSKFWHDLLDVVLYARNMKNKLGQSQTFDIDDVQDLKEWLEVPQSDIALKVLNENRDALMGIEGVVSVGLGKAMNGDSVIRVITEGQTKNPVPKKLYYNSEQGKVLPISIELIHDSAIEIQVGPGSGVANSETLTNSGSVGCAVCFKNDNDQKPMLLSCYHVLKSDSHSYDGFEVLNKEDIKDVSSHKTIGTLWYGVRNNTIDAAFAKPVGNQPFDNVLPNGVSISGTRKLKLNDEDTLNVIKHGSKTGETEGVIDSLYTYAKIRYRIHRHLVPWEFYNLIAVSQKRADGTTKSISEPGDSGAPVIDSQNRLIGLIVGGNKTCTYVMPIDTILDTLNLKLL